jgi:hypothetical protein
MNMDGGGATTGDVCGGEAIAGDMGGGEATASDMEASGYTDGRPSFGLVCRSQHRLFVGIYKSSSTAHRTTSGREVK